MKKLHYSFLLILFVLTGCQSQFSEPEIALWEEQASQVEIIRDDLAFLMFTDKQMLMQFLD